VWSQFSIGSERGDLWGETESRNDRGRFQSDAI
jgi:hypothetical protein